MKKNLQVKRTAQDAVSVCPNGNEITYHNKDVASKVTGEALMGSSLAPFGLPHIKIVDTDICAMS